MPFRPPEVENGRDSLYNFLSRLFPRIPHTSVQKPPFSPVLPPSSLSYIIPYSSTSPPHPCFLPVSHTPLSLLSSPLELYNSTTSPLDAQSIIFSPYLARKSMCRIKHVLTERAIDEADPRRSTEMKRMINAL